MAQRKPTEREVRFARGVLHYLHANETNGYLILAIIAWVRRESGSRWIGNNPLNIRNSKYAIGKRKGPVGYFAVFASYTAAARATAAFLVDNQRVGNYAPIIKAAKMPTGPDGGLYAAKLFLRALGASKWSADHYGYEPPRAGYWRNLPNGSREWVPALTADQADKYNKLFPVFYGLTGFSFPKEWFVDKVPAPKPPPKPKAVPIPAQPRPLRHIVVERDYLDGFEVISFYDARHMPVPGTTPETTRDAR